MLWSDGMSRQVETESGFSTDELFEYENSKRVIDHPETPSAYIEWREILPILSKKTTEHVGNLLDWSYTNSKRPLGSSREIFANNFEGADQEVLDEWMYNLSQTSIKDFIDFHLPFMRNFSDLSEKWKPSKLVGLYLEFYNNPSKGKIVNRFPEKLIVETTKSCNFSCVMCSSRTNGFQKKFTMDLEVFGEVIRVFSPHSETIRINGYGEASIIPNIEDYIGCLDEFSFEGQREIITNLSASYRVYEHLANEDFVLLVSWDAVDENLFKEIRVGADYDKMLKSLNKLGNELSDESERLILLSTVQEKNIDQIVPLVDLASDVGAGKLIFNIVKEEGDSKWMKNRFQEIKSEFTKANERAENLEVDLKIPDHIGEQYLDIEGITQSAKARCDRPFKEIQIRWNTELSVCNMFNPYYLGILFRPNVPKDEQNMKKRFERLWNGPNYRLFRSIVNTERKHPYCEDCYYM